MDQEPLYQITRKEMHIIKSHCYHPYWEKCGGLNPCDFFDEVNCCCEFNVDAFISLICKDDQ